MKIHKISDRKSDLFKYCPRLEFIISLKNWHSPFLFIPPHATVHPAPRPPLPHQFATSNSASIFRVLKPDFKGTQAEKTVGVWRISLRQLYDKAVYLLRIRVKEVEMYNSFHIHFPYRPLCGYKGEIVTSLPHIPALPPSMPAFYPSLWFLPLGNRDRYYWVLWFDAGLNLVLHTQFHCLNFPCAASEPSLTQRSISQTPLHPHPTGESMTATSFGTFGNSFGFLTQHREVTQMRHFYFISSLQRPS